MIFLRPSGAVFFFFIAVYLTLTFERHLKKGSIFISTKGESVYLVNGIIDSWEELLFGVPTPIIVDAVLLPFKDCIITDGLVSVIPVRFGGNYTRSFKDIYMTAKRNGSIIKSIKIATCKRVIDMVL